MFTARESPDAARMRRETALARPLPASTPPSLTPPAGEGGWRDVRGEEGGERGRRPALTLRPPEESGSQNAGLRKDTRIILKYIFPPTISFITV